MRSEFVRANELYDIESQTRIAHPAHQATDNDVRHALENREVRADGGHSSSATERTAVPKSVWELHHRPNPGLGSHRFSQGIQPYNGEAQSSNIYELSKFVRSRGTGTERTGSDEGMAVTEPSRGWANEAIDDRHPIGGAGVGCGELLRTPHVYTAIGIRSLQTDSDRTDGGSR